MLLNEINDNYYGIISNLKENKLKINNLNKMEKAVVSYLKLISKYNNLFLEDKLIENDVKSNKVKIIIDIWNIHKSYFYKLNNNTFFEYRYKTKSYKILKGINYFFIENNDINLLNIQLIFNFIDGTKSIVIISLNDLLKIKNQLSLFYIKYFN